jgi:hypothetical protein
MPSMDVVHCLTMVLSPRPTAIPHPPIAYAVSSMWPIISTHTDDADRFAPPHSMPHQRVCLGIPIRCPYHLVMCPPHARAVVLDARAPISLRACVRLFVVGPPPHTAPALIGWSVPPV